VVFSHDTEFALQSAVVLANSALPPDTLTTVEDLDRWYEEYSFSGRRDGDERELEQVRALRPVLRELFTSDRDHAAAMVNAMLEDAKAVPQLVRHEPFDWHIHAVSPDAPLVTRITVETAMAMVDVIRSDEMSRLGICADDDCGGVVLDLSRNRSRRFCSTACGNPQPVSAEPARRAAQGQ
jgi:predicted RNA-binding Zn ribbon-like protein